MGLCILMVSHPSYIAIVAMQTIKHVKLDRRIITFWGNFYTAYFFWACLCVFGGIVGLILMSILVLIVNMWSDSFTLVIFWSNLVIGVVISAVIGLVSGILPAYTASRLNPVDAIRSK